MVEEGDIVTKVSDRNLYKVLIVLPTHVCRKNVKVLSMSNQKESWYPGILFTVMPLEGIVRWRLDNK